MQVTKPVSLSVIRTDGGTQMRSSLDESVIRDYADQMAAGDVFPPVMLFQDEGAYWLADGFHRVAAAQQNDMSSIGATVQAGGLIDAIRYALSANATNGKQRSREDMRRAYEVAVQHDMVPPTDSEAVSKLLRCSVRWARELTSNARAEETARRNARIEALAQEGHSQHEIASSVGMTQIGRAHV